MSKEELDFVTKLQEEKEYYMYISNLQQDRINKAIHLIRHNDIMDYRVFEEKLLSILTGDDNTSAENLYRYTPEKGFELVGGDEE